MALQPTTTTLTPAEITPDYAAAQQQLNSGAGWFYWIAALSAINALIIVAGSNWSFFIGLGVTQIIEGVAVAVAAEVGGNAGLIVNVVALVLSFGIAGMFVLFGWFARKGHAWSFIVGMALYALDGVFFVLFSEWLSIGFHVFALFGLYNGFRALQTLRRAHIASYTFAA